MNNTVRENYFAVYGILYGIGATALMDLASRWFSQSYGPINAIISADAEIQKGPVSVQPWILACARMMNRELRLENYFHCHSGEGRNP